MTGLVEERLRRDLHAVAASVEGVPPEFRATAPAAPRRRRRRLATGLAVGVAVAASAYGVLRVGPEYVDRIPPEGVILTGEIDGERYWVVEAFHEDGCGEVMPGVEYLRESHNVVGSEWNSFGAVYGEVRPDGCGVDTSGWLADPARWEAGSMRVGDGWLTVVPVHPSVTEVAVWLDGAPAEDVELLRRDGAGYAVVEVPGNVDEVTVELHDADGPIEGSRRTSDRPYGEEGVD